MRCFMLLFCVNTVISINAVKHGGNGNLSSLPKPPRDTAQRAPVVEVTGEEARGNSAHKDIHINSPSVQPRVRCHTPFGRMGMGQTIHWIGCRKITCQAERGFPYLLEQKCPPLPKNLPVGCKVLQPLQTLPYPHCCPNPSCASTPVVSKLNVTVKNRRRSRTEEEPTNKIRRFDVIKEEQVLDVENRYEPDTDENLENTNQKVNNETLKYLNKYPLHRYEEYQLEKNVTNENDSAPLVQKITDSKNKKHIIETIFEDKNKFTNTSGGHHTHVDVENTTYKLGNVMEARPKHLKMFSILKDSAARRIKDANSKNDTLLPNSLDQEEKITVSMISDALSEGLDRLQSNEIKENTVKFIYIGKNPKPIKVNNSDIIFYDQDGRRMYQNNLQNERTRRNTVVQSDLVASETKRKPVFHIPWKDKIKTESSLIVEITKGEDLVTIAPEIRKKSHNRRRNINADNTLIMKSPPVIQQNTSTASRSRTRMAVPRILHQPRNKNESDINTSADVKTKYDQSAGKRRRGKFSRKIKSEYLDESVSKSPEIKLTGRKVADNNSTILENLDKETIRNTQQKDINKSNRLRRMRKLRQRLLRRRNPNNRRNLKKSVTIPSVESSKIKLGNEVNDVTASIDNQEQKINSTEKSRPEKKEEKPTGEVRRITLRSRMKKNSPRSFRAKGNAKESIQNEEKILKPKVIVESKDFKSDIKKVNDNTSEEIKPPKTFTRLTSRKRPSLAQRARLLNIIRSRQKQRQKNTTGNKQKYVTKTSEEKLTKNPAIISQATDKNKSESNVNNHNGKVIPSRSIRQRLRTGELLKRRQKAAKRKNSISLENSKHNNTINELITPDKVALNKNSLVQMNPKPVTTQTHKQVDRIKNIERVHKPKLKIQPIHSSVYQSSRKPPAVKSIVLNQLPVDETVRKKIPAQKTESNKVHILPDTNKEPAYEAVTKRTLIQKPAVKEVPTYKPVIRKRPVQKQVPVQKKVNKQEEIIRHDSPLDEILNNPNVKIIHHRTSVRTSTSKPPVVYHPLQNTIVSTKPKVLQSHKKKDPFEQFLSDDDDFAKLNYEYEPPNFDFPEVEYKEPAFLSEYRERSKAQPQESIRATTAAKQHIPQGAEVKEEEFIVQGPAGVPIKVKTVSFHTSSSSVRNENVKNRSQNFKSNPFVN